MRSRRVLLSSVYFCSLGAKNRLFTNDLGSREGTDAGIIGPFYGMGYPTMMHRIFISACASLLIAFNACADDTPRVRMTTSEGVFEITLQPAKAPQTVANFLEYVESGYYAGTIFHRVIGNFMIQGGGFDTGLNRKRPGKSIQNEADNGLANMRGTIAMARTNEPHSAQAQFFINVVDNDMLNFRTKTGRGWGYAVFGKVTTGMEVVDRIRNAPTTPTGNFQNLPTRTVIVEKAEIISNEGEK